MAALGSPEKFPKAEARHMKTFPAPLMRKGRTTFGVGLEENSESVFLRLDSFRFFKMMKKVLIRDSGFQFQGSIKMKKKMGWKGGFEGFKPTNCCSKGKKSWKAVSKTGRSPFSSTARVKFTVGDLHVDDL